MQPLRSQSDNQKISSENIVTLHHSNAANQCCFFDTNADSRSITTPKCIRWGHFNNNKIIMIVCNSFGVSLASIQGSFNENKRRQDTNRVLSTISRARYDEIFALQQGTSMASICVTWAPTFSRVILLTQHDLRIIAIYWHNWRKSGKAKTQ